MVIIITGAHKALALQKCIEEGVNHMWTLSSLQLHPHAMIVVDEDATMELRVKTVKVGLHWMCTPCVIYILSLYDPLINQFLPDTSTVLQVDRKGRSILRHGTSPTLRSNNTQEARLDPLFTWQSQNSSQPSESSPAPDTSLASSQES